MRRHGLRVEYDLADVPEDERVYSPDLRSVVAFYVARRRSDVYDNDIDYEIAVWDAATGRRIALWNRDVRVSRGAGIVKGKAPDSVEFTADGHAVAITYEDGSREVVALPGFEGEIPSPPAAADAELSPELREAQARSRQQRKPLVLVFVNSGLPLCRAQLGELERADVKSRLERFVVQIANDAENEAALERFAIKAIPTILVLSPDGAEFSRVKGLKRGKDLESLLDSIPPPTS